MTVRSAPQYAETMSSQSETRPLKTKCFPLSVCQAQQKYVYWSGIQRGVREMRRGSERGLIQCVRRGISDQLREQIWPMLISAPMREYRWYVGEGTHRRDIDLDLRRTFPMYKDNVQLEREMRGVLNALASAMPELGYCQGMNFIVGVVLLRLDERSAFDVAYYILHWLNHEQLLRELGSIYEILFVLQRLGERMYPNLMSVLRKYEIDMVVFASSWFITLFCSSLPIDYSLRVLECFMLEGEKVLYRVALMILKVKKRRLKQMQNIEDIVEELKRCDEMGDVDAFFEGAFALPLSRKDIAKYRREFKENGGNGS